MPPKSKPSEVTKSKSSKPSTTSEKISIQSFYKREVQGQKPSLEPEPVSTGDGFTEEELNDTLDPLSRKWNPEREYEEANIGQLVPGPHAVTFAGRIVNLSTLFCRCPKQPKATGFHSLIVKDDSGAILIKLYFAQKQYPLQLGQLLSLWTAFVSDPAKTGANKIPFIIVCANMFPGRVTSDHVMMHSKPQPIYRTPLEYTPSRPLSGLMTLASWLSSGHDGVTGAKILVCVKSIGARKTITRKDGTDSTLTEVRLFDHTGEVRMTVWNDVIESTKAWLPGKTVLLIGNPVYKIPYRAGSKGTVGLQQQSMIDVEPEFPDAEWLRKYAVGLTKKETLGVEYNEEDWDVEAAEYGVNRMLFTLAELDTWVRSDGSQIFTGFLNLTITSMSLVQYHRQNMLLCAECCGIHMYSNNISTPCRNCNKPLRLSLNPKIVGPLLDETGCIGAGKMVWSPRAWEQLFGRSVEEVASLTAEECRLFEQRALWMRMHLCFGWGGESGVGRLVVLGMMM